MNNLLGNLAALYRTRAHRAKNEVQLIFYNFENEKKISCNLLADTDGAGQSIGAAEREYILSDIAFTWLQ